MTRSVEMRVKYYERGGEVALGYRLGDKFLGAWGEADRLRITDPELRAEFVQGYLANLPRPIHVDKDNVIIRIEGVSKK
jgi:hypothetical protein